MTNKSTKLIATICSEFDNEISELRNCDISEPTTLMHIEKANGLIQVYNYFTTNPERLHEFNMVGLSYSDIKSKLKCSSRNEIIDAIESKIAKASNEIEYKKVSEKHKSIMKRAKLEYDTIMKLTYCEFMSYFNSIDISRPFDINTVYNYLYNLQSPKIIQYFYKFKKPLEQLISLLNDHGSLGYLFISDLMVLSSMGGLDGRKIKK